MINTALLVLVLGVIGLAVVVDLAAALGWCWRRWR
jgi:hypothetical protein